MTDNRGEFSLTERRETVDRMFRRFRHILPRTLGAKILPYKAACDAIRNYQTLPGTALEPLFFYAQVSAEFERIKRLEPTYRGQALYLVSRCHWIEEMNAKEAVRLIRDYTAPRRFSERSYWRYLYGDTRRPDFTAAVDLWFEFIKKEF